MAYIGVQPAEAYTSFAVQHFTTSATTSYTLDNPVANENEIALFINNVRQEPGSSYAYTASGTTLTLSAATSASDTMYCVFIGKAVQTVTPTLPIANFSSTGIDDNATSTAATIDSSGNVLVGKTSDSFSTAGAKIQQNGQLGLTASSNEGISINRLNSDGSQIIFYKDGTNRGNIGTFSNLPYFAGTSYGMLVGNTNLVPSTNTGAIADNLVDLGASNRRFKDLYLSGGLRVGGTGAANALDDYEEGTWSPVYTATGGSITATTTAHASYVKVGNMVYIQCKVATYQSSLTGDLSITGLPFTSSNVSNKHNAFAIGRWYQWNTDMPNLAVINDPNTSTLILFKNATNASSRSRVQGSDTGGGVNNSNLVIMGCYQVD